MKLSKNDLICGQPAVHVRDLLKLFSSGHYQAVNSAYFTQAGMSIVDVQRLILALHEEGYLEAVTAKNKGEYADDFLSRIRESMDREDEFPFSFNLSIKGRRFASTRFSARMKRKTVERLVKTVTERARLTSTTNVLAFEIDKLWVLGSYLDEDAEDYGNLDLVVETRLKASCFGRSSSSERLSEMDPNDLMGQVVSRYNEWERQYQCGDIDCGPPKPDPFGEWYWDFKTTNYFLKRKNPKISLHSMNDFEHFTTTRIELLYDAEAP